MTINCFNVLAQGDSFGQSDRRNIPLLIAGNCVFHLFECSREDCHTGRNPAWTSLISCTKSKKEWTSIFNYSSYLGIAALAKGIILGRYRTASLWKSDDENLAIHIWTFLRNHGLLVNFLELRIICNNKFPFVLICNKLVIGAINNVISLIIK